MEKKIYFGVVSKATPTTMVQTKVTNGMKKELEVKGLQVTFNGFTDEENKEVATLETIDKEGNVSESSSFFVPFCKIEQLFDWGVMLDFVRIILPVADNVELQRLLSITLVGETVRIECIRYETGEFLANENTMIVRNYQASISLEKFEAIASKLQERADERVKEAANEKLAKSAAQNAAVFGAV